MGITVKAKISDEWRQAMKKVQALAGVKGVKVGIVEKATNSHTGDNIAFYAACNEFGTDDIPARPFMRMTAEQRSKEWARIFSRVTSGYLISDPKVAQRAFTAIGRVATADMHEMILSNIPPRNAKAYEDWKKAKKGSKEGGYWGTLVYTGQMLQSINFKVVKAGEKFND